MQLKAPEDAPAEPETAATENEPDDGTEDVPAGQPVSDMADTDQEQPAETRASGQAPAFEPGEPAVTASGLEMVEALARELASKPYQAPPPAPKAASQLNYDQFRRIQNLAGSRLWEEGTSGYQVRLDPRGYLFSHKVKVNIVADGQVMEKAYDPGQFDFLDLPLDEDAKNQLGYSGFRILAALNRAGKFDEVISFRGASFFRALGAGTVYGASARGISIGTASSEGEEFPLFREFWLVRPDAGDAGFTIYALLDGKSVTGAYEFRVHPGPDTVVDVRATIIPRRPLENFGIIPLTSMYYFSPHDMTKQADDFRPAVHDSEGLAFRLKNGEWVWRPLTNPQQLQVSVLAQDVPLGFGLMQRQRDFDDFSDIEAGYHLRPSVWVEPGDGWQRGELTLVEIPTSNEYNDNIVVFWKPSSAWKKGEEHRVSYRLHWARQPPVLPEVTSVAQTRSGRVSDGANRRFVIDFRPADAAMLDGAEASVSASAGSISNVTLKHHDDTGLVRLSFELDPGSAQTAELRALLTRGGKAVTETWIYRWRGP